MANSARTLVLKRSTIAAHVGLDKSVIRSVVQESAWVGTDESVFVLGPTGVRKSFVASALAQKSLPRRLFGFIQPRPVTLPRPRDGAGRWQPAQSAGAALPHRRSGDR